MRSRLLDRLCTKRIVPLSERITLTASRRETNKFLNQNFRSYLSSQLKRNHTLDLEVSIKSPHQDKCLQVVDFASWAVFRKLEHGDESYYRLIRDSIIEESPLFP